MTSRERLLALLQGRPVDRCGVCTYTHDGLNNSRLREEPSCAEMMPVIDAETEIFLGWGPKVEPNVFLSTSPDISISEEEHPEDDHVVIRSTLHTPKDDLHSLCVRHDGVATTWKVEHYLKTDEDVERFLSMPYVRPRVEDNDFAGALARVGERGLVEIGMADPICYVADLFEFGDWTIRAWQDRKTIRRLLDAIAPRVYDWLDGVLALGISGTVFRLCGPEYASEPYVSPALFREFVTEYDLPIARKMHDAGCYLRLHSHGRLGNVLDHIMELEPDILEPVEGPPSGDITIGEVARRVGRDCVLMGNLEPRELEFADAEVVDALVREIMASVAGHSPLIVAPTDMPIAFPLSPVYARNIRRYVEVVLEEAGEYN
ncbi:MAG: hypothetical protein JSV65_10420 [Armatimonadota bacterium]|nr:MAG: hypothetical protein JSV65_10420 [Armatimonadota bacterium]